MTYTIYPKLIRDLEESELYYFRNLLMPFTAGIHKVAIDRDGVAIDIYSNINRNREMINSWLSLMSYKPSRFVIVPVDISHIDNEERKFLTICKGTKGQKKMIVGDVQSLQCDLDCNNCTVVDGETVQLLDKDEAVDEISKHHHSTTIIGSILAKGNVTNSNNKV